MDVKTELDKINEQMAWLKFELFKIDNRRADLVNELLKLQGQVELLGRLDGAKTPILRSGSQPKGGGNAGPNP